MLGKVHKARRNVLRVAIIATLLVGSSAAAINYRTQLAHAFKLATSHQPEQFTELSFRDVTHLPTQVVVGKKYTYVVLVTSHETVAKTYTVTATTSGISGAKPSSTAATITLEPGASSSLQFGLQLTKPQQAAMITVGISPSQHIYFRSKS